ncbi:CRISPR/Cas system CSM-associated protein Csm3, group 7 of RAMP superfamily [Saccharopolyspora kobensis]|uniref:CRISPR/Cas system CSM-associated protein Csm3, group 7 of RAMP superfamily n=1 Tax=Saccharopolyspora kobensis TaxID=146035 RepID=A0A1H5VR66_9PSEU|nr:RAMP superfamily CRISPR-associated protein [Saccharopolyspora kobensis]SEF89730.1 CRISPR/Cas system CSM-associated protein Csm3, group 7 of RAMP superfamily [Saccharopolyspora kobensis]SFC57981.1 CRISPR/Cas system CSM-associated protein Csm3, group 7 of RAMP superfamily [Saccharopolyspora kobensis]
MKSALIRLRLRMETAGGVTAPESAETPEQTLLLRTDTAGKPHLPGATVAGSLRAHTAAQNALKPTEQLPDLFGSQLKSKQRAASPVQVLGTIYRGDGGTDLRRRTAINRERGGADNLTLHTIETLPAGTEFDVVLRWDNPDQRYDAFIDALRVWRPQLGRGGSTGAGFCTVTGLGHQTYDLTTPDGLLAWLAIASTDDYPEPDRFAAQDSHPEALLQVDLDIVDGIHIGAGEATKTEPAGPDISRILCIGNDYIVPGSTLKGVLRSRTEYICRVVGAPACPDQACGECAPCTLFGCGGTERTAHRAKIAIHDAVITDPVLELRHHVALDRFTGGSADGLLYTDEVVTSGSFRLRIDPLVPRPELSRAELLLLEAVVTDLDDGLIGIGARSTAGLGTVRVTSTDWKRPENLADLAGLLTKESAA